MTEHNRQDMVPSIDTLTDGAVGEHLKPVIEELVDEHLSDCLIHAVIDAVVRPDFEARGLSLHDRREDTFDWSINIANTPSAEHLVTTLVQDYAPYFTDYCNEFYPCLGLVPLDVSLLQNLKNIESFNLPKDSYYFGSADGDYHYVHIVSDKLLGCDEGRKALRRIFTKYINSRVESFEDVIFSTLKNSVVDQWTHHYLSHLVVTLPDGHEMLYDVYLDYLTCQRDEI